MTWGVAIGFVMAAGLFAAAVASRRDKRVSGGLSDLGDTPAEPTSGITARIGAKARLAHVHRRVAELVPPEEVDRFVGRKIILGASGMVVGAAAAPSGIVVALFCAIALAVGGFVLPDFLLARSAKRPSGSDRVPDLLDGMAAAVGAGLTPRLALERTESLADAALADELERVRRDASLGTPWLSALRAAGERTRLPELHRLVATLERSERLGAPVAGRLRDLAREVRAERRARAEERARRAPVLMLFPLVFLILPAFVLSAVVPALIVATGGIR